MAIHPTAIIDSGADIHESVEIGPYTVIDGNVKIGEGCRIGSHVRIYAHTTIGKNNRIDAHAILGADGQDLGFDSSQPTGLVIGDNNVFREQTNIHRATKLDHPTTIGNDNYFMGSFHVGHDCTVGNNNIMVHGSVMAGHVHIGNRVLISGLVAIHQFCNIGDYAMVAGCAKIVKDVPPFATADENPATIIGQNVVGMKRAGSTPEVRKQIKAVYDVIYHQKMNTSQALKHLKDQGSHPPEVQMIIEFFENSKRGVTDHR